MKKIFLFSVIFSFHNLKAQQFYNLYPSNLDITISSATDVLEADSAYYKIETETNDALNFHSNIRIIKTDVNGNIIWAKRYDAGTDSSLAAISLKKTIDNNIIVNSELANDNSFPPLGVSLFELDTSGVVIWSALLPGFRGGFNSKNIIQLPDSSFAIDAIMTASLKTCVIIVIPNAATASAKMFQNMLYSGVNTITSLIFKNNIYSISFDHGEFITTDTSFTVLTDKNYNIDMSGPYFTHTVTANGNFIFIDDIVAGGLLNGMFRIFRTDSANNLIWAKSLTIWKSFTVHNPFTLYDVVKGVRIFEDTSGNIVVHLLNEEGLGLAVTFDAAGNYVTNKVLAAIEMKLCEDGDFVFVSNNQTQSIPGVLAKQLHYSVNNCDSLIDVQIANGTDSVSSLPTATNSVSTPAVLTGIAINVSNTSSVPAGYCTITTGINSNNIVNEPELIIHPDPSSHYISVALKNSQMKGEAKIFNSAGVLIIKSILTNPESNIDISGLHGGIYFLETDNGTNICRQKFIKQ